MITFRTIGAVGVAGALLLSSAIAFAKDGSSGIPGRNGSDDSRQTIGASTTLKQKNEDVHERLQNVRESAKALMITKREEADKHLKDIKDKAKQDLAKRLATQFDNLNSTWTDKFIKQLDGYDAILQKIQDRATIAANAGKDVSSTTAAIQSAKTAIANTRTAVIAQAAKTYVLDTTTLPMIATSTDSGQEKIMQGLRKSFQTLHSTLFKDLFAIRDGVMKDARKAVQNALQTLGKVRGADDDHATSTSRANDI